MKKIVSSFISVFLLLLLCGCGSKEQATSTPMLTQKTDESANTVVEVSPNGQSSEEETINSEPMINLEEIKKQIEVDFEICSGKGQSQASSDPRDDSAIITITNNSDYNLKTVNYKLMLYKGGELKETREGSSGYVLTSISSVFRYDRPNDPFEYDNFSYEITSVEFPEKDSPFYGNVAFSDLFDCKYQMNGNKAKIQIANRLNKRLHMEFYILEFDANDNILFAFPGSTAAKMANDIFEPGKTYGDRQFLLEVGCKRIAIAPRYVVD